MTPLDELTEVYHRHYPHRKDRMFDAPDWLPALLDLMEKKLDKKIDAPESLFARFGNE